MRWGGCCFRTYPRLTLHSPQHPPQRGHLTLFVKSNDKIYTRSIFFTQIRWEKFGNKREIDYEQLYAQVLHEINDLKIPYWFNNEQVARIQELNLEYMEQKDIAEVIDICFRKPKDGEPGVRMKCGEMVKIIQREYPFIKNNHSTKIHLGIAMKELGYEGKSQGNQMYYRVVPLKAA